jgi:hypothetical protein
MEETQMRPVEVNGHQEYWRGWFHGWTHFRHADVPPGQGTMMAVVETEGGGIAYVEPFKIKFLDSDAMSLYL